MAEDNKKNRWWLLLLLIPVGIFGYNQYRKKTCTTCNKGGSSSGSLGTNVYNGGTTPTPLPITESVNTDTNISSGSLGTSAYNNPSGDLGTAAYLSASLGVRQFTSWYNAEGWWFNK